MNNRRQCVIHKITGKCLGVYSSMSRACTKSDKVDNEYGGYITYIISEDEFIKRQEAKK